MGDFNDLFKFAASDDVNDPLYPVHLLVRLLIAGIVGGIVALVYRLTQRRGAPSEPSFVSTLVLLCVLLAMVPQVIGDNAARAFSLVGILAIVRFRTTVEDTRDTAFVVVVVMEGMAVGVGNFLLAGVGLVVISFVTLLLRLLPLSGQQISSDWTLILRVGAGAGTASPWDAILAGHCDKVQLNGSATARQGASLDLTYQVRLKPRITPMQLLNEINRIEGIQNVEMKRL
jgi:hypothetical protein